MRLGIRCSTALTAESNAVRAGPHVSVALCIAARWLGIKLQRLLRDGATRSFTPQVAPPSRVSRRTGGSGWH